VETARRLEKMNHQANEMSGFWQSDGSVKSIWHSFDTVEAENGVSE
jgi:hypothetical protein